MAISSIWIVPSIIALIAFFLYKFWSIGIPALVLASMRWKIRYRHRLKDKKITVGSVNWSFLRGGTGIPLILLPGFGSHKYQWGNELYKLSLYYDLIIPDLPGGGGTRVESDAALTPTAQAERVHDLIKALGINSPCVIISSSVGGLIAGLLVKEHPALVSQLILIDPAGLPGTKITEVLKQFVANGKHPFGYKNHIQLNDLYSLLFKTPPKMPKFIMKHLALMNRKSVVIRDRYASDIQPFILDGLKESINKFPNETLLIWGRHDSIFDSSAVDFFSDVTRNPHIHIVDAGHLPYLEKPEEVYQIICSFLAVNSSLSFNSKYVSCQHHTVNHGVFK